MSLLDKHQKFYFLSPVEVVKVTSQNMKEVAEWCGGKVAETESRRVQGRMDPYVWVPTPKSANISWAFPGMFVTKRLVINVQGELKETYAVFRRDYFEKNYWDTPEAAAEATWERQEKEKLKPAKSTEVKVMTSVGDALAEAMEKNHGPITINVYSGDREPEALAEDIRKEMEGKVFSPPVAPAVPTPMTVLHKNKVKTVEDTPLPEDEEEWMTFRHKHVLHDGCDMHNCPIDRYLDGDHYFIDKLVIARPGKKNVVTDINTGSEEAVQEVLDKKDKTDSEEAFDDAISG